MSSSSAGVIFGAGIPATHRLIVNLTPIYFALNLSFPTNLKFPPVNIGDTQPGNECGSTTCCTSSTLVPRQRLHNILNTGAMATNTHPVCVYILRTGAMATNTHPLASKSSTLVLWQRTLTHGPLHYPHWGHVNEHSPVGFYILNTGAMATNTLPRASTS